MARLGVALGWEWHSIIPIRRALVRRLDEATESSRSRERSADPIDGPAPGAFYCRVVPPRHPGRGRPKLRVEGEPHLLSAMAEGRGVVALTARLGSKSRSLRRWLRATAQHRDSGPVHGNVSTDVEILRQGGPKLLSARGGGREAVKALRRGEIVGFVLTNMRRTRALSRPELQHPPQPVLSGGEARRRSDHSLVHLARRRYPCHLHWCSVQGCIGRSTRQSHPRRNVRCTALLETAIREHPEQWLWYIVAGKYRMTQRWYAPAPSVGRPLEDAVCSWSDLAHRAGSGV